MTYFVSLKLVAILVGLIYIAAHLPLALAPTRFDSLVRRLPRNYPLGVILMLIATIWFVALTGLMDLGELSNMRVQLMIVWAVAGILTAIFVPGFLAARALGCLLLLAAALVLDATFLAYTPWRFCLTILAYVWVIAGMVLVYSPHFSRDIVLYVTQTPQRCRLVCWPGVVYGLLLVVLGLFFYPAS